MIDDVEYLELSPTGQIFHETFRDRFRSAADRILPPPAQSKHPPRLEGAGWPGEHPEIQPFMQRVTNEVPFVVRCETFYFNRDLPERTRFYFSRGDVVGLFSDGRYSAKFRVETTAQTDGQRQAAVAALNQWLKDRDYFRTRIFMERSIVPNSLHHAAVAEPAVFVRLVQRAAEGLCVGRLQEIHATGRHRKAGRLGPALGQVPARKCLVAAYGSRHQPGALRQSRAPTFLEYRGRRKQQQYAALLGGTHARPSNRWHRLHADLAPLAAEVQNRLLGQGIGGCLVRQSHFRIEGHARAQGQQADDVDQTFRHR